MSTIPAAIAAAAEAFGDRPAVVDGDVRLTYAELLDEALTFGAALVAGGIEPGDRVAVWAPNRVEWIVALLGLSQAGCVLVPVNTRFKGAEAAEVLSRSGARALVTVDGFLGNDYLAMLGASGVVLPELRTTVVIGTDSWSQFLALADDDGRAEVTRRAGAVGPDDWSDILFTSGTTGTPKGVVQTQARTMRVASDWVAMTGLTAGDRYLMVNPYFHMFGLKAGILASVVAGATMYPEPVFDVDRALARVAAERITVLPGAPTLYQSILDHPDRGRHDLSSLRVAVTGAADIPVELIRRVVDELPFPTIITGYGLTEGGTACATSPVDDVETIATTVGRPRPGFELRIDGPPGEPGEILLKGGSIMSHYLDDPEATAAALSPDGWLRTGDLGIVDDAGCLRIVGRSKDMFIVGGFNAYPAEIENALLRHPDILQAAVIGIPDERLGEVGMAFVVLRPGASTTGDDVVAWSREQMANYKAPRAVEIVEDLPLNATGKVQKDQLRARVVTASDEGRPVPELDAIDWFTDDTIVDDPRPYYAHLQTKPSVCPYAHHGVIAVRGYDAVVAAYRDHENFSSAIAVTGPFPPLPFEPDGDDIDAQIAAHRHLFLMNEHMISMDPPEHTDRRSLLARLLTPKRLKESEDFLWGLADRHLDEFVANGRCELLREYAKPYTLLAIADLLGVPEADHQEFRKQLGAQRPGQFGGPDEDGPIDPLAFLESWFSRYIEDRRREPRDDVLTGLATATYPDGTLPDVIEPVRVATFVFAAGQDTTGALLGSCLRIIAERPELQAQLRANRDQIPAFIEEVLRLEGTVKSTFRLARRRSTLGGVDIAPGTVLLLLNAAANRDPGRFDDPEELRVDRANSREQLSFGRGAHSCPGGPLARVEVRVSLERFLDRMADIRLSEEEHGPADDRRFSYEPTYILRALKALHLEWDAAT